MTISLSPGAHYNGVALADSGPTNNELDLPVWPLETDRGAEEFSGDQEDPVPIYSSVPDPNVRWLTPDHFRYENGYRTDNPAEMLTDGDLE